MKYDVYFGDNSNPPLVSSEQLNDNYDPGFLNIGTIYHWKVVAKDGRGGIIEGNKCGLTADPLNPREIARALEYLLEHPNEASEMGENGRKAVIEKYNWETESKELVAVYEDLLKRK